MIATYHCPKCDKLLEAGGELTVDGNGPFPVFYCDICTRQAVMFGEAMELPYTFLVNGKGEAVDPVGDYLPL